MKRLVKRYIIKAQNDKECDEVNEGECVYLTLHYSNNIFFATHGHRAKKARPTEKNNSKGVWNNMSARE